MAAAPMPLARNWCTSQYGYCCYCRQIASDLATWPALTCAKSDVVSPPSLPLLCLPAVDNSLGVAAATAAVAVCSGAAAATVFGNCQLMAGCLPLEETPPIMAFGLVNPA